MTQKLYFTAGDRLAVPEVTLENASGAPIDLTGLSVVFLMVDYWSKLVLIDDEPATVMQGADVASRGKVRYDWSADPIEGLYQAWFVVSNGVSVEHYPVDGGLLIKVYPNY